MSLRDVYVVYGKSQYTDSENYFAVFLSRKEATDFLLGIHNRLDFRIKNTSNLEFIEFMKTQNNLYWKVENHAGIYLSIYWLMEYLRNTMLEEDEKLLPYNQMVKKLDPLFHQVFFEEVVNTLETMPESVKYRWLGEDI